ncbi:MAG: DUF2442 domain-containing protein [SAR202 cluster bacterium]|nr:DUF2442 domain-containing protein [SAR202 cluster bacterium]
MSHPIHRVTAFEHLGAYSLLVRFSDGSSQAINFLPVLAGEIYGELRNPDLFGQVRIDPEVHTLVWPNGADFDPATLHDWPEHLPALRAMAQKWAAHKAG